MYKCNVEFELTQQGLWDLMESHGVNNTEALIESMKAEFTEENEITSVKITVVDMLQ